MKIVIAGAGDIGFHLAKMLSSENHDIVLIDLNESVLEYAGTHIDVLTVKGDSSSVGILTNANVSKANLFIAVTTNESVNIVSCILAKQMGAVQTIARVSKSEFWLPEQKQVFQELGVDKIIYPSKLASLEVRRLIKLAQATDNFEFEGGKISVIGIRLIQDSPFIGRTLKEIDEMFPNLNTRPIAILRAEETILPRSNTRMNLHDHVYFITPQKDKEQLLQIVSKKIKKIKNIMILGGEGVALETALLLENEYNITIVTKDKSQCKRLVEHLHNSLVIEGEPSNFELLKEEGLANMDALIAATTNSETNIITSLMAGHVGVYKTIALVDNTDYTHISQHIGVDTMINKKLIAANNIFRFVRKGKVEAITSLHGVDAEIIEYVIHHESVLTQKNLRSIKFPEHALIGGVIRGETSYIPNGDFQLEVNDKVIVLGMTSALGELENLFT